MHVDGNGFQHPVTLVTSTESSDQHFAICAECGARWAGPFATLDYAQRVAKWGNEDCWAELPQQSRQRMCCSPVGSDGEDDEDGEGEDDGGPGVVAAGAHLAFAVADTAVGIVHFVRWVLQHWWATVAVAVVILLAGSALHSIDLRRVSAGTLLMVGIMIGTTAGLFLFRRGSRWNQQSTRSTPLTTKGVERIVRPVIIPASARLTQGAKSEDGEPNDRP